MFTTVRYFIKTGIGFLLIGILTGLFLLVAKNFLTLGFNAEIISAHTHVILLGSVMMIIMGVAIWFFPRAEKTDTRYNPDRIRLVYWLMTAGTGVRYLAQLARGFSLEPWLKIIVLVSSAVQVIALMLFFYTIWSRIRPVGSHIREAKGEKF